MLLTEFVMIRWHRSNRGWYENKGYIFAAYSDEFEVKVKDLSDGSMVLVDVQCDGCGEILKDIPWYSYKKYVKDDSKYYCHKCAHNGYKKWISLYDWCYENLPKEEADNIMARWDYEKNIDKNENILTPKDVSYASVGFNKKGYWFKCLDHLEHESEQKLISSYIIKCTQCNTIFITHPHIVSMYSIKKEDAIKYSFGSNVKIIVKCPECGAEKEIRIHNLIRKNFNCPKCSDGVPYSEKFMFNVLEQLNIDFQTQLSKTTFKWCGNYKYDNYLIKTKCIIETHGLQHYEIIKNTNWGKTLEEIQENDIEKEQLAKDNDIKNYIVLDCRKSELEWIKDSLMTSELPELLNFKEEDIDWLKCHEYACSNLIKKTCELWNCGFKISVIAQMQKINRTTVVKHLKQASEFGWCFYNPKEEIIKNYNTHAENMNIKVICLTTNEVFNSIKEASEKYNIKNSCLISACCKKIRNYTGKLSDGTKLLWMYYTEYLTKNSIPGWYDNYINNFNFTRKTFKIICITTGKIFDSQTEGGQYYNINIGSISSCCGKKIKSAGKHPETGEKMVWMYYDEYIKLNPTPHTYNDQEIKIS